MPHAFERLEVFDFRFLHCSVAMCYSNVHSGGKRAAVHTSHGYPAGVTRVAKRRDKHLRRSFELFGRGYHVDYLVEQVSYVVCRLVVIRPHPALLCRTVNHREVELFLGCVERAHEVESHFIHLLGAAVGLVHLVYHHYRLEAYLECLLQHEARLRHRAFEGIDKQNAAVGHVEHALHLAAEVAVPRSIDDVDFYVLVTYRNVLR